MNQKINYAPLYLFALLLAFSGCKKSSGVTTIDYTPGSPVTVATPYVVRTVGVSGGVVTLDTALKIYRFRFGNGAGNSVQFWPGSDLQLELANANTEPLIQHPEPLVYNVVYPNVKRGQTTAVVDADSATYLHFKVKGFNFLSTGFSQLNVILCDDGTLSAGIFGFSATSPVTAPMLTNTFLNTLFYAKVAKLQISINGQIY